MSRIMSRVLIGSCDVSVDFEKSPAAEVNALCERQQPRVSGWPLPLAIDHAGPLPILMLHDLCADEWTTSHQAKQIPAGPRLIADARRLGDGHPRIASVISVRPTAAIAAASTNSRLGRHPSGGATEYRSP